MINSVRQAMFYQQQANARPGPSVSGNRDRRGQRGGAASAAADIATAGDGADIFKPLLGKWQGMTVLANRNGWRCGLDVELREDGKHDGTVNGYTSLACAPLGGGLAEVSTCKADPAGCVKKLAEQEAPTSSILSGKVADGAIHLQAKENLATAATGCVMASAVAREFGAGRIAFEWQDMCGGGQMVLTKR